MDGHVRAFKKLQVDNDLVVMLISSLNRQNYCVIRKKKKSITLIQPIIHCIERFFSWSAENPECTSLETVNTKPEQRQRLKHTHKVSVLLSPYLYDSLETLANHDYTDIPTMLNALVSRYVAHRKSDIERAETMSL